MIDRSPRTDEDAAGHRHLVQFYEADPAALVSNVVSYFETGLAAGDAIVIIATAEHTDAFLRALSSSGAAPASGSRALVCLDADATLARFMVDGAPDWRRFEQTVGGIVKTTRLASRSGRLHAYGEMVGLLWLSGQTQAAITLERFWNVLLQQDDFTLFCGYPIDVFDGAFKLTEVGELLCAHSAMLPGAPTMAVAVERAMDDVLGVRAHAVREGADDHDVPAWQILPAAEKQLLWVRENLPEYAEQISSRARAYHAALRTA